MAEIQMPRMERGSKGEWTPSALSRGSQWALYAPP